MTSNRLLAGACGVAVALGVAGWIDRRAAKARDRAACHLAGWLAGASARRHDEAEQHLAMALKWMEAARYPWLPVEPDPPGPG